MQSFSVAHVLELALRERPDAEALVGRFARYSYRDLDDAAARAAAALARLGVGPGDRVAATLPNHPDIVVACLGAMRLGGIWLGINRALAPPEKAYLLGDAEPRVTLADPAMADQLRDLGSGRLVTVDPEDGASEWATLLGEVAPDDAPVVEVDPHAPAAIAYTGGTTGFPKGVVHSQHNLVLVGAVHAAMGDHGPDARFGVVLPLTILNVMALTPLKAFQMGASCVTMDRVDPVGVAEWVRTERVTSFGAVPAIVHGLLTHPDVHEDDLETLTRPEVGGADCPEEFRALYRARFGTEVALGYGMTEAPTAVTLERPEGPNLPGGAGVALPHVRITVRDEEGGELGVDEIGEVCVEAATEGPWAGVYTPMLGYWKQPEASAVHPARRRPVHRRPRAARRGREPLRQGPSRRSHHPRRRQRLPRRGRTDPARRSPRSRRARWSAAPTSDSGSGSWPTCRSPRARRSTPRPSGRTAPSAWPATRCPRSSSSSTTSRSPPWARSARSTSVEHRRPRLRPPANTCKVLVLSVSGKDEHG